MKAECPGEDELAALLEPDTEVAERIESHLAECPNCQGRLEQLSATVDVVSDFVAAIEPPDPELESKPELQTAITNARTRGFDLSPIAGRAPDAASDLSFLDPPDDPAHLGKLGGFEVIELIAEGGMGLVFRGRDRDLERDIAIKVLNPDLAVNEGAREMFLSEARAAASLDHENVLPIHLVETSRAVPFLVMPLVKGGTLHDRLGDGKPLDFESEVQPIALAAARALAAAHGRGLIHRDVKPANLMLEPSGEGDGRVWLADFGLARAVQEAGGERGKAPAVAGTPHFLAPELLEGEPASERSDLFALGVVFYAMAAGRLPFTGKTSSEVMASIRETAPAPIDEGKSGGPAWFAELTRELLAQNPEKRLASARDLVARLESHVEAGKAARIRAPLFRNIRRIAAIVIAMAGIAAGTVAALDLTGTTSLVNAFLARSTGEPFGIRSRWGVYSSLSEAVDAAPPGATLEIFHDGRLALPNVRIRGVEGLTIEPARGFAPLLVNEETNGSLIGIEDGELTLRNLAFQQNISVGLRVFPVIRARRASLTLENFSLRRPGAPKIRNNSTGIRRPAFIDLIDCPRAVFRNGLAQAKLSTFLLISSESKTPERRIEVENCFTIGSQFAVVMGHREHSSPIDVSLDRWTGFHRVPFLITRHFGPEPLRLRITGCALTANEALFWTPLRQLSDLPDLIPIEGENNVLAVQGPRFLNVNSAGLGSVTPTEGTPADLSEFRALWELPESFGFRIEDLVPSGTLIPLLDGNLTPDEGLVFSEASGMPSAERGADLSKLGPRLK